MDMANIFDKVKNLFGKELSPAEQLEKDIKDEQARLDKLAKQVAAKHEQLLECNLVMQDCRRVFNETIMDEQELAREKRRKGLPTDRERGRIQEAAIGIMVTDIALMDLQSIKSESDLNRALNTMGKALKQLVRMDNSVASINRTSRNYIDMFFPGFKGMVEDSENYTTMKNSANAIKRSTEGQDLSSIYEIPQSVRSRINETFVDNVMKGDSYKMAMSKAVNGDLETQPRHTYADTSTPASVSGAVSRANDILKAAEGQTDDDIDDESYKMTSKLR